MGIIKLDVRLRRQTALDEYTAFWARQLDGLADAVVGLKKSTSDPKVIASYCVSREVRHSLIEGRYSVGRPIQVKILPGYRKRAVWLSVPLWSNLFDARNALRGVPEGATDSEFEMECVEPRQIVRWDQDNKDGTSWLNPVWEACWDWDFRCSFKYHSVVFCCLMDGRTSVEMGIFQSPEKLLGAALEKVKIVQYGHGSFRNGE